MPVLSKTGLIPSVPKKIKIDTQPKTTFDVENIVIPAPYVMRPFAGIYNPFPYGCSVLCNHPADLEAKNVVKKAKDTWAVEGRGITTSEDLKVIKCQRFQRTHQKGSINLGLTVPEELFRRYTETDSRPLTPAPTVISLATRHSQLRRRRCMTPDPVPSFPNQERTLLVLDLRRSHSQETITWIGSQQGESVKPQTTNTSRATSSLSRATTNASRKKKLVKSVPITPRSEKAETQREEKSNRSFSSKASMESKTLLAPEPPPDNRIHGLNTTGYNSDCEIIKRRGKRKKGKKGGNAKEDKEFRGFPEPGETQVSTLRDDSRVCSKRPSLTTGACETAEAPEEEAEENTKVSQKNSFLQEAILKQLQRQLDHEVVESELDPKRKIALEEALRLSSKVKPSKQNQEIKSLKKEFGGGTCPEKWLSLPRIFTRQSARFELPMDTRMLNDMNPLQYAERYVFPSDERMVLYNHVFNLHMEEFDEDEEEHVQRILLGKNVVAALGDIMGRAMAEDEAREFQAMIGWSDNMTLDFRMFTGISAICERLMAHRFCSKMPKPSEDLKHEVERADFETLDRKLLYVHPGERMVRLLRNIRDM